MRGESECLWCDISVSHTCNTGPLWWLRLCTEVEGMISVRTRRRRRRVVVDGSGKNKPDQVQIWFGGRWTCLETVPHSFFFPFLNPSATWFSCWTINERPLRLKRGLWVRCEVGGIVKSWLNGLEPVTWTHSCISRRGREHSPPRAGPPVNAERRVLQPQNNGAPCWCKKEAAAVLRIKSERHLRLHSDMIISHQVAQFIIRFCLFSLLRSPWGWSSEFHWPR